MNEETNITISPDYPPLITEEVRESQTDTENTDIITTEDEILTQINNYSNTSSESQQEDSTMNNEEKVYPEIPLNSDSLLIDNTTARFSDAVWYNKVQQCKITLAGVGGIGSWCALLLSRMKPAMLTMYDPDIVETVNMSGQLYRQQDVGVLKSDAISKTLRDYSCYFSTLSIPERFTSESEPSDIMICGFDNMLARKTFFSSWCRHINSKTEEEKKDCLFIDGRLEAESLQILCIRGDDDYNIHKYKKDFLFSDEEADETICSYKQTTFMATMIGSLIVNLFVNFVANMCNPIVDRDLPFYTEYSAETMYFKTII